MMSSAGTSDGGLHERINTASGVSGGNGVDARRMQRQTEKRGELQGFGRLDDAASRQHKGRFGLFEDRGSGRGTGRYDEARRGENGEHSLQGAQISVSKPIVLVDGSNVAHSTEGEKAQLGNILAVREKLAEEG